MNFYEFDPTIRDIILEGSILVEKWQREYRLDLFESNQNVVDINNFFNIYAKNNIANKQVSIGQDYVPITIISIPTGKFIIIQTVDHEYTLLNQTNDKLFFEDQYNSKIVFPYKIYSLGDSIHTTFLFDNNVELDKFLLHISVKFSDWNISKVKK
jgi:hypothetical protein